MEPHTNAKVIIEIDNKTCSSTFLGDIKPIHLARMRLELARGYRLYMQRKANDARKSAKS